MRYPTSQTAAARQPRSLRIGRCARCHASVVAADEHYGDGAYLVHAACVAASEDSDHHPPALQQPRRTRRLAPATGRKAQVASGRL
jgi:hypothetical protein